MPAFHPGARPDVGLASGAGAPHSRGDSLNGRSAEGGRVEAGLVDPSVTKFDRSEDSAAPCGWAVSQTKLHQSWTA